MMLVNVHNTHLYKEQLRLHIEGWLAFQEILYFGQFYNRILLSPHWRLVVLCVTLKQAISSVCQDDYQQTVVVIVVIRTNCEETSFINKTSTVMMMIFLCRKATCIIFHFWHHWLSEKFSWNLEKTRGPKGHISCIWVQWATFLTYRPGRQFLFTHRPEKHKLGRGCWYLASCQVSLNSVQRFQRRKWKCLSQ